MAIYILENNPIQSAFLKKIIQKRIAGTNDYIYLYTNSDRFYKKICLTNEINLYFLTIELNKELEASFRVAKRIRKIDQRSIIVFISSHSELALHSYKCRVSAFTFINKTDSIQIISSEINACIAAYHNLKATDTEKEYMLIETKTNKFKLDPSRISHIESIGFHKIAIYGTYFYKEFYGSLSDIFQAYNKYFKRVHRSYLVNFDNVIEIDRKNKLLETNTKHKIPISRNYYKEIDNLFKTIKTISD